MIFDPAIRRDCARSGWHSFGLLGNPDHDMLPETGAAGEFPEPPVEMGHGAGPVNIKFKPPVGQRPISNIGNCESVTR